MTQPDQQDGQEPQHDQQGQQQTDAPPAGGNVDELPAWAREALNKANREAAGYRTKVRELEPLAQKAKELDDASKSEVERASERAAAAEKAATESTSKALRLEVALEVGLDKGLTKAQVQSLAKRLVGGTKEELEADAAELVESFGTGTTKTPPPSRRPNERLRGGSDPDTEPEPDARKAADQILSRR